LWEPGKSDGPDGVSDSPDFGLRTTTRIRTPGAARKASSPQIGFLPKTCAYIAAPTEATAKAAI